MSDVAEPFSQRVPPRAVVISAAAFGVPMFAALGAPEALGEYGALLWLLAVIPAFLLAYHRGWRGAATALAFGMASLSVTQVVATAMNIELPRHSVGGRRRLYRHHARDRWDGRTDAPRQRHCGEDGLHGRAHTPAEPPAYQTLSRERICRCGTWPTPQCGALRPGPFQAVQRSVWACSWRRGAASFCRRARPVHASHESLGQTRW